MVVSMDRWKGKVAVVTGAATGIGAAITKALVASGLVVVGLDVCNKPTVTNLIRTGQLHWVQTDISKETDVVEAFRWIKQTLGTVHVLVNNAGVYHDTTLIDGDYTQWKHTFDVNVLGLCTATREAVRQMQTNNVRGHIIHINSLAGHLVPTFPNMNVYSATKFAVTSLTETLRLELNSTNGPVIKVTSISPGAVKTETVEAASNVMSKEYIELFKSSLKPEDVADGVLYVLGTPPHVQVHELIIRPIQCKITAHL